MSKGPSGNTTTTTKSDPWSGQQPYLTTGFQQAQNLYNPGGSGGPQYFPGQTYAPPTDQQNAGLSQVGNLGLNGSAPGNAASNADTAGINGSQGFFNNVASQVLPQIQGQFASGNRMDSGLATRAATSGLGSAWMNNQLNYMNQAPGLNAMQIGGAENAATAGQMQQQNSQAGINDQIQRYNYGQQLPYSNLNNYMNLVQGNYGANSTTSQPYFNNTLGQIGAAAGGLGGLLGATNIGPWALGLLSDERLKTDIRRVGTARNGVPIHLYRFKGTPEIQLGVLAQEVMKIRPRAVHMVCGLYVVNYAEALSD